MSWAAQKPSKIVFFNLLTGSNNQFPDPKKWTNQVNFEEKTDNKSPNKQDLLNEIILIGQQIHKISDS